METLNLNIAEALRFPDKYGAFLEETVTNIGFIFSIKKLLVNVEFECSVKSTKIVLDKLNIVAETFLNVERSCSSLTS